jgi:maltose alpha-D-glucosyltransferase / alpha-amylase
VLARITGARKGAIIEGMLDDQVCNKLLEMSEIDSPLQSARGAIKGVRAVGLEMPAERRWARGGVDQSNTVAFVSDRYVLKLFRRLDPGPNPEFEIGRALTKQGFNRIPTLAGALLYDKPGTEESTLAVVQSAVPNQGSGWSFTIEELRRYYERVAARINRSDAESMQAAEDASRAMEGNEPLPFFASLQGWYLGTAGTLGRRTAELHLALAEVSDPAFEPELFDTPSLRAFARDGVERINTALDLLERLRATLPQEAAADAATLLDSRAALVEELSDVERLLGAGLRIRVHGDYHLGQVLRSEEDFVILDFEGEPARPLAARRAKQSPLKDVAGMLRSFHYAAYAAVVPFAPAAGTAEDRLAPWADAWQHWVSRSFLDAYRQAMGDTVILPRPGTFDQLLHAFIVDKAIYELTYELNNRPEWARIPLKALVTLALPLQR